MNKDILEGKWKQIRGEAKAWWGKLTDDDLDRANGKFDVLAGLLQEKYGYTRQRAELASGRAYRPCRDHLHVRHDGQSQGRDAYPREHRLQRAQLHQGARRDDG